jgi:excisionase family DNA binding protein
MAAICYSWSVKNLAAEYLSTTDAAILAVVSARHLVKLIVEGKIHAQKIGRNWLVSRESAEGFSRHPSMGRPKKPIKQG